MLKTTLLLTLAAATAIAGNTAVAPAKSVVPVQDDWCKSLWEVPVLYKGDGFFKEVRLIGRFHGDVYSIDSDQGHESDWEIRRLRIGAVVKLAGHLELKGEVQFDPQNDNPAYAGLTEVYIAYKPNDAFNLKVGKIATYFTHDGWISSNNLQTLERNNLSNNFWFPAKYFSGVAVSGKVDSWLYNVGVHSSDQNKEFGDFNASWFGTASLGYNFGKALGVKSAILRADFMYQDVDPAAINTRSFEQVGSLNFALDNEKWGISTDLTGGIGSGKQSDGWGFMVQPWYKITEKLEAVGRYTHLESNDPDGLRFGRYENRVVSGRGDEYDEFYAGLNYYICGHKLKLMTGLEYAEMDGGEGGGDYEGWTWTSGLRLYF